MKHYDWLIVIDSILIIPLQVKNKQLGNPLSNIEAILLILLALVGNYKWADDVVLFSRETDYNLIGDWSIERVVSTRSISEYKPASHIRSLYYTLAFDTPHAKI